MGLRKTNIYKLSPHSGVADIAGSWGKGTAIYGFSGEKVVQSWKRKLFSPSSCLFIGAFLGRVK